MIIQYIFSLSVVPGIDPNVFFLFVWFFCFLLGVLLSLKLSTTIENPYNSMILTTSIIYKC